MGFNTYFDRSPAPGDLSKTPTPLISPDEVSGPGTRLDRFRNVPNRLK